MDEERKLMDTAFEHFRVTLKLLNESMGMCLPISADAIRRDELPTENWTWD